jgi:hypothetical protein
MKNLLTPFALVVAAATSLPTAAQLPNFNMQPGKWSYTTRTEIPGIGAIPVNFEQCVTQKDIDEGRSLSAQKDAGMDCKYQDLKNMGSRFTFTAVCRTKDMPEPLVMNYDMTATSTQFDAKMSMTGGHAKAMGGKMNMTMSAKRLGGC